LNKLRNQIQFLFVLSSVRLFQGAIPMTHVTFAISDMIKWLLQVKLEGLTRIDL